ncbi:MAG: hypothetical protein Q9164_001777 [Protoblastenia rupestris]
MAYKGARLPEDAALKLYGIRNLDTIDMISRTSAEIPHNKAHTPSPPTTRLGTAVRASAPAVSAQYPAGFGTCEASTPAYERAKAAINDTKAKAKRGNYNADLPIVAPEAHFQHLEVLYRDIVQSSAFFRSGGSYHLQSTWDGDAAAIDGVANVPDWLSLSQYQMVKSMSVGCAKAFMLAHLWESYLMICQCSKSLQILKDDGFCDYSINILIKLEALDVAEITEISLQSVENLKVVVEKALIQLLGSTDAIAMSTNLMEFVLMPCASFLDHIGLHDPATNPGDTESILKFCRTTACLLDLAIITYTGSHASRFDLEIFGRSLEDIHVVDKENALRFSCTLKTLACLNGFLDNRRVWVFKLPLIGYQPESFAMTRTGNALAVLAKIHLLADIWGPVWTVPGQSGMNVLGTRPATWNVESRSISFSVTKVVGASMIGTQKLVPHTPVKQQTFDTWTNKPNTANPEFLNQAYGVETSHCTGNARRMAVRELLLTDAIWPILEAQKPGWTQTRWGLEFKAALGSQDPDAVIAFWVGFPERRADVAELVCCVIDNLDTTGCFGDTCEAAYLSHNQRMSVALDGKSNDWSVLLKDSRKMASYVVINNICLEVVDLGSGYSTCQALKAFTVLQTQLTMNGDVNDYVFLEPPSKRFWILNDVDKILTPDSSLKRLLSKSSETIGYEVSNRQNRTCDSQTYIRSSTQSYQGWKVPRRFVHVQRGYHKFIEFCSTTRLDDC